MNYKISHKLIKEKCGSVSFKRGEAFYRSKKVTIHHYSHQQCTATVSGADDFHVTISINQHGDIVTECNCPKLLSYHKECQHIAAVLHSMYEIQRQVTNHILPVADSNQQQVKENLAGSLMEIFSEKNVKSSGQQPYFETRQVLQLGMLLKPITTRQGQKLFSIGLYFGELLVQNIREFLKNVNDVKPTKISASFTFDPSLHCFQNETNMIIQQLIQIYRDESLLGETFSGGMKDPSLLVIPATVWQRLFPLLTTAENIDFEVEGNRISGLQISEQRLPIQFKISENEQQGYLLSISGINDLLMMNPYHLVIYEGQCIQLNTDDSKHLSDLKQMIESAGTNRITIHKDQVNHFIEKVIPGLRKLGEVRFSEDISKDFKKTPLVAKLFLDRVKNRLLAGLEFHYGNIVINPFDSHASSVPLLLRDKECEKEILTIMQESEFAQTDSGYFLHNEELEYEFLTYVVPKLQKLVQIYATTAVRNRIFRENTRPQVRVRVKKERTNWLEFKFEMDGIPNRDIKEILAALEEKRKFYRLRNGSLLSLETREFEDIQRFMQGLPVKERGLDSGLNLPIVQGLQLLDSFESEQTLLLEESFRDFMKNISNPEGLDYEVPQEVDSILRDYQKHGYKWMKALANYGFGGVLADDMGLGKTLQSITFILSELSVIREKKLPVLIVCPASLTYNWLSELMKFAPILESVIIDGSKIEREKLQKDISEMDVVITSYPLLRKDLLWYEKQTFHTVFFDEAQSFKNPITQTARAVKRIKAENRFALTGTPIENSLEELWSIFHVVFPELFKGLKDYSNLTRKQISRRIRPFLLRRLKEDVLGELPQKIESLESVELLPEQKKLYAAYLAKLRHDTLKHLDKDTLRKNKIKILAGLTRLRQICCHPALFVDGYKGNSAKFKQLLEILEEARRSGRRVLIFSQFTKMLALIGSELAIEGHPYFYLDGQTPSEERLEICNRFNLGERDLFLISLKAGGTGLNLTGANTVILYDIWWNPAVEEQAADRAHRIGQTNVVQVIKLVTRGTIEEKMNELQEKKRDLIEELIDSEGRSSTALTEEDIRELLMI
ncbi:DEAD/DEAH box helicase [Bacillus sp. MRMR6]|uniref:DEAD/DEAH box helicase n=1 Tax=Bacillus sp. MRMR6 TaxID=1928617 RepID=UPI0009516FBA|nr:DEAD/DEAH box helicase [Bacillus sp. MRMR6]OLS38503.1 helicase SNF [Bacillus sp. MRMR6]